MYATGILNGNVPLASEKLLVPESSVLWTGKRSLVYLRVSSESSNLFKATEVELGPKLGNNYIILSGLSEGDEIVKMGVFAVDASAQLAGKRSMLNE